MSVEDGDKISDNTSPKPTASENVSKEAASGKADLADSAKQYISDLKSGMKSGITDQFGKPLIFDDDHEAVKASKQSKSSDGQKTEQISSKSADSGTTDTSDLGKPYMLSPEAQAKAAETAKLPDLPQAVDAGQPHMLIPEAQSKVEAVSKAVSPDKALDNLGAKTGTDLANEDPEIRKIKDAKVPLSPEQEKQLKDDLKEIDKLPEDQKKKVRESLDTIATADTSGTTKLDAKQRAELISSVAHQLAHPESIKQGDKDTCVAANVEKTMAMTHPDQYADMVAQMATKGEYTTPDGKTKVEPQRDADGKLSELSDPSKQRSATSEMMQNGIMNLGMPEGEKYKSYKPGHEPIPDGIIKANDTGERIQTADGKEKKYDGLPHDAKENILNKLAPNDGYQSRKIQNAEDLGQAWKDNGEKPPMNVAVRINAEHTGMGDATEGYAATHAVSVTHIDYDANGKPTQVYYENTASPSSDHSYPNGKPVPADEFVKSMQAEREYTYKRDGSTDHWTEPLTATVRTDCQPERASKTEAAKSKELDDAVAGFRDSTHKDAIIDYGTNYDEMRDSLKGRPRWEIEEINKRYKEKYGVTLEEEMKDECSGKKLADMRKLLLGNDTKTEQKVVR